MSLTPTQASVKAIELVSTALQSGSITLRGTQGTPLDSVDTIATIDAKYLAKLLTDLSAAIQKLP